LLSLLFEASLTTPTVYVTGILGILLSPYAIIQQRKITEIEALRLINEQMEKEVNQLSYENDHLKEQVNTISSSVAHLRTLQNTLDSLSTMLATKSITDLEQQIEQTKLILSRMEQNNNANIVQNLIKILLSIDSKSNHDMKLSDHEIDQLIQEVETISDIEIDTDKVRYIVIDQHQRSMKGVIELARQTIINHDPNDPNSIFKSIAETETNPQPLPPPTTFNKDDLSIAATTYDN
jgi:hypothetical protein